VKFNKISHHEDGTIAQVEYLSDDRGGQWKLVNKDDESKAQRVRASLGSPDKTVELYIGNDTYRVAQSSQNKYWEWSGTNIRFSVLYDQMGNIREVRRLSGGTYETVNPTIGPISASEAPTHTTKIYISASDPWVDQGGDLY
jgi:hypothetical protein